MSIKIAILATLAAIPAALAAPAVPQSSIRADDLSLIKTSATDPGQWVTEQEKLDRFTSKNIGFIDITDVADEEVLSILSGSEPSNLITRAINYPSGALHKDEGSKLVANINTNGPKSWLKTFTDFHNRRYNTAVGAEAANWLFGKVKEISSKNTAITVKQFKHTRFNQQSIIAKIPGSSSNLVVVGAHLDSTSSSSSGRSPGAEDDGSGSVVILEALRVLAESGIKPKNTIEFHWYAGEEGGLLGSKDVWANYKASNQNVIGYLNQDMAGWSPSGTPAVFQDFVNSKLSQYITALIKDYFNITPNTSRCGYGCSDHASATANGFPSAFVADEVMGKSFKDIHTERDTYDIIMWPTILLHSKIVASYLLEASYI